MEKIRIQKIIADAGYCSRRKAEELIDGGKVFCENGWVMMRHSNVRSVIKVYVQADSKKQADQWVQETLDGIGQE